MTQSSRALAAIFLPFLVVGTANAQKQADASKMKPYVQSLGGTEVKFEMLPIPGGAFVMGSGAAEKQRKPDEGPQHRVTISPFWMSKCEITWNAYDAWGERIDSTMRKIQGVKATPRDKVADAVTRPTPPYTDMSFGMGKGKNPAICMTQHAARMYCEWLTAKTGHYYRLPTEAEWEYACRAGTKTAWHFGNDAKNIKDYAWFEANSDEKYHPVGKKKPNPWGLHDMHGNVSEWVLDQYIPGFYKRKSNQKNPLAIPSKLYPRVVRGGGWDNTPDQLRSAARIASSEDWKEQDPQVPQSIWYHTDARSVGIRLVRPFVPPTEKERAQKWSKTAPEQKDPPAGIDNACHE